MTVLPQTMLEFISSRDHRVMRRLNSWRAPRWIRLWMICATRGGDGWLWYSIGLCVLFFGGKHAPRALPRGRIGDGCGSPAISRHKTNNGPAKTLRYSRALLGQPAAPRSVLISLWPFDHRVFLYRWTWALLSGSPAVAALLRLQRCHFPDRSGNAFPQ